jgi:hypothetical protein
MASRRPVRSVKQRRLDEFGGMTARCDPQANDEEKLADIYIGLSALESYQHLNEVVAKLSVFLGRANNPAIYALPICYQCNEVCINSFL